MDTPSVRFTTSLPEADLIHEALENLHAVTKAQCVATCSPRERTELTRKLSDITTLRGQFRSQRVR